MDERRSSTGTFSTSPYQASRSAIASFVASTLACTTSAVSASSETEALLPAGPAGSTSSSIASAWSNAGPWDHGPAFASVHPRQSSVTGCSYVGVHVARSCAVRNPGWGRPESSITGYRQNLSIASATNPVYQAARAASICASRVAPRAASSSRR